MKKLIQAVLAAVPAFAFGYDWQSAETAELKSNLVVYAESRGAHKLAKAVAADDNTAWIDRTFRAAEEGLRRTEGLDFRDDKRETVLRILDYPLHLDTWNKNLPKEELEAWNAAVKGWIARARERIFAEAAVAIVPAGKIRLWHFYNMGYLIKGERHTVAVDVSENPFDWPQADVEKLVSLSDLVVRSHPHGDHFSKRILEAFTAAGKPVVTASDIGFDASGENVYVLATDNAEPLEIGGIEVRNYHGYQWPKDPCNVYLLTIDGVTVVAPGDNQDRKAEAKLGLGKAADVVISAIWNDPTNIVRCAMMNPGVNREKFVYLPSHFNELGHPVFKRESYWEGYVRKDRLAAPGFEWPRTVIMAPGESLLIGK